MLEQIETFFKEHWILYSVLLLLIKYIYDVAKGHSQSFWSGHINNLAGKISTTWKTKNDIEAKKLQDYLITLADNPNGQAELRLSATRHLLKAIIFLILSAVFCFILYEVSYQDKFVFWQGWWGSVPLNALTLFSAGLFMLFLHQCKQAFMENIYVDFAKQLETGEKPKELTQEMADAIFEALQSKREKMLDTN